MHIFRNNLTLCLLYQGGAEFVFPTDSKKKRSWGEQMFSGIGTSYMCGMICVVVVFLLIAASLQAWPCM